MRYFWNCTELEIKMVRLILFIITGHWPCGHKWVFDQKYNIFEKGVDMPVATQYISVCDICGKRKSQRL